MKTMKRIMTLALALMLILALALPAMAADTYKITIMSSKSNSVAESGKDHLYEAYQILKGNKKVDGEDPSKVNFNVTGWGDGVNGGDLLTALKNATEFGGNVGTNPFSSVTDAVGFAAVLEGMTAAQVETVANYIEDNLTSVKKIANYVKYNETDKKYQYEVDVELGYYLIKDQDGSLDNKENKDYTNMILHVSNNVTVYHKGSIPTVEKTVSEYGTDYTDAIQTAMNKDYYYRLIATLPSDFDSYDTYKLEFVDTLGAGIDYIGIVDAYALRTDGGAHEKLNPKTADHAGYEITLPTAENSRKLTITFANLKHDEEHGLEGGDKIVIIYKAKLNNNAVIGNTGNLNEVKLNYSNNPNSTSTGTTTTDGAKVYTFGMQVIKKDGQTGAVLEGVKFRLYHNVTRDAVQPAEGEGTSTAATETVKEYAIITNGEITGWTENVSLATDLVTDANGKFFVEGLNTNVYYYLEETASLSGYRPMTEPVKIYLTATIDTTGKVTYVNMNEDNQANITGHWADGTAIKGVTFEVPNYPGAVLPETGGIGTTIFYILGSVMVLGAALLLITKKRVNA